MARHALYDGTCKVAVEYRCNEYNMEDNAQHKQLGDIIVGGRVSHYRPRYVVWSCLATTESLFGINSASTQVTQRLHTSLFFGIHGANPPDYVGMKGLQRASLSLAAEQSESQILPMVRKYDVDDVHDAHDLPTGIQLPIQCIFYTLS